MAAQSIPHVPVYMPFRGLCSHAAYHRGGWCNRMCSLAHQRSLVVQIPDASKLRRGGTIAGSEPDSQNAFQ